jgi:hypothetical protein
MSVQNISLYIPHIQSPITENDLVKLLQETCHLGEIENIEMFEDLLITPEQTISAFVYFQFWYPTLGNQCLQVELMNTGKILIPLDGDRVLNVFKNDYFLTPSVCSEEAESETEMKERVVEEFMEMEKEVEEADINEREIMEEQEEILFEQYYQEMEEVMRLMGEESFDLVSADYASRLETQLGALISSNVPISVIQN